MRCGGGLDGNAKVSWRRRRGSRRSAERPDTVGGFFPQSKRTKHETNRAPWKSSRATKQKSKTGSRSRLSEAGGRKWPIDIDIDIDTLATAATLKKATLEPKGAPRMPRGTASL